MFHVEQFFISVFAVSLWGSPLCASVLPIPMGGNYQAENEALCNDGLDQMLFGRQDKARQLLTQAYENEHLPLAAAALLLFENNAVWRERLTEALNQGSLTPAEEFYIRAFLEWSAGNIHEAAKAFKDHAEQYRADTPAVAWYLVLAHYAGQDVSQEAQNYWQEQPDQVLLAYARALAEESTETVSDEALQAAEQACHSLPNEPMLHLLHGHLLFRHGDVRQSVKAFQTAEALAGEKDVVYLTAGAYEATALWSLGQLDQALAKRRELNAGVKLRNKVQNDTERLYRWEINFLPLRVLITRPEKIALTEIRAAKMAATPKPELEDDAAALLYRDCLVNAVLARYHAAKGKKKIAIDFLAKSDLAAAKLKARTLAFQGGMQALYFRRACEACTIALCKVRAELYPEDKRIWEQNAQEATKPSSYCLPPLIPQRLP